LRLGRWGRKCPDCLILSLGPRQTYRRFSRCHEQRQLCCRGGQAAIVIGLKPSMRQSQSAILWLHSCIATGIFLRTHPLFDLRRAAAAAAAAVVVRQTDCAPPLILFSSYNTHVVSRQLSQIHVVSLFDLHKSHYCMINSFPMPLLHRTICLVSSVLVVVF